MGRLSAWLAVSPREVLALGFPARYRERDSHQRWNTTWQLPEAHLIRLSEALESGIDVIGYIYWTLIDNYEWTLGIAPHFFGWQRLIARPKNAGRGPVSKISAVSAVKIVFKLMQPNAEWHLNLYEVRELRAARVKKMEGREHASRDFF